MAGLNFGNVIDTQNRYIPVGYKGAESGQSETEGFLSHTAANAYETIYTVTTGKTFYLSTILISNVDGVDHLLAFARGAAAAEVDFMSIYAVDSQPGYYTFAVPLKFTSGTRISIGCDPIANDTVVISISGFEE